MAKSVKSKPFIIVDGVTIKYHADGKTIWSRGKIINDMTEGYWEWYRKDGTLKRSGRFYRGNPVGEWITYDSNGNVYKTEHRGDVALMPDVVENKCQVNNSKVQAEHTPLAKHKELHDGETNC